MFDFGWRDIGTMLGIVGGVGAVVIGWIKYRLSPDFASKGDIEALGERIEKLEGQVSGVATQADLGALRDRMGALEKEVGVTGAHVSGIREGVGRMEHELRLLTQHLLRQEANKA